MVDYETVAISFAKPSISENGEKVVATVSRSNTDVDQPLTVQLQSSDTTEVAAPASVIIPAGQTSTTIDITAVDDSLLDGTQVALITLSAAGYQNGAGSLQVTDYETITLTLNQTTISENGGTTQATVTRSNIDNANPITVFLSSSDSSQVTLPSSVTIAANQASATFTVTARDNALLDGTRTVNLLVSAFGYEGGSKSLSITDFETLSLTIDPATFSEAAGTAVGRVTRNNTNLSTPLTVQLLSSDTSEAQVLQSVVIPADQAFVDFNIQAVDDDLLDGSQSVTVSATAVGYQSASRVITVTDAESLSLSLAASEISEKDGTTTGTVTRNNSDIAQPLTVSLASSDASEATVPATVTIPAGSPSVTFPITAVDDDLLDGTVSVTITASAVTYASATANLGVRDLETLSLSLLQNEINEAGGSTLATVRRNNTNLGQALTVQLSATNASQINLPDSITIPAGQSSVSFNITSVDDTLLDGTQTVQITATAAGYVQSTSNLSVTDAESLALQIDRGAIDEVNGRAVGTVTRSNTDLGQALTVTIANDRPGEVTVLSSITIPAGQSSTTFEIVAVDDQLLDGPQAVTLSASAAGYATARVA